MKKIISTAALLASLLLTSCLAIPGYINKDGNITPPYSKTILIEAESGDFTITPMESSLGRQNINPAKSSPVRSHKNDTIYLHENDIYTFTLEGNHGLTLAFRTINQEAKFKITYKNKTTEYIIHNSDICDKMINVDNF